jgi:folate-binding protein YgfZ
MATQAPPQLESQYRAIRNGCALLQPGRGATLLVTGPDAIDFLQGQVTNDVAALEPGRGCYALLLNPKGRILADMRILMLDAERLLIHSEQDDVLRKNLTMYTIGRQVEVEPARKSIINLLGPGSDAATGLSPPIDEHSFMDAEIDGVPVHAVRTRLGIDLVHPEDNSHVLEVMRERSTEIASEEAAEVVRIESGLPRYGMDMTADNLPGELGLDERAVSFTKGCYVGQEPVARMHHRGHPNRHLRGLKLSGPASRGQELLREGKQMGVVTSTCVSPSIGHIALALVRREVEPGESVELSAGNFAGTVVELPFELDG